MEKPVLVAHTEVISSPDDKKNPKKPTGKKKKTLKKMDDGAITGLKTSGSSVSSEKMKRVLQ